ncbi:ferric iron reductase protein FhuF [Halopseudomonas sabulinigri]|uniref:Ferric iron reductase protein FhuF n=1 Tax=Halopseudomonas sabulinigri TaxID=472181 RepID=A0A1H1TTR5_9GAMM|nr:siderophore-iron reductase FhuF [Halopseudomonas sabulinigri]SDS63590.1 ferric iron reductase protein FhuF [Halopseudomonas sabulinigri]
MIAALASLFQGPLAPLGDWLTLVDDPRPGISMADYLNSEQLSDQLQRFAPQYVNADQRALVSLWGKYHFMRLVAPVVTASLLANWRLPVHFNEVAVIVGDDGLPSAFKLPDQGAAWSSGPRDGFSRFESLFDGHLDVLIRDLAARYKVAPKVFWSSVGHYYEWIVEEVAKLPVAPERLAQARQLISDSSRPDGLRNPLYGCVRYRERAGAPELHRERKHCCIRYLLPDKALCSNCPHLDKPPAGYDPAGRSD